MSTTELGVSREAEMTEFLLARIVEDEGLARKASVGPWSAADSWAGPNAIVNQDGRPIAVCGQEDPGSGYLLPRHDRAHIARHDPDRVLAESVAKRRIVSLCELIDDGPAVVAYLAAAYADHPDYRDEWRPYDRP